MEILTWRELFYNLFCVRKQRKIALNWSEASSYYQFFWLICLFGSFAAYWISNKIANLLVS